MRQGSILVVAVASEVLLILLAYAIAWFFGLPLIWNFSVQAALIGAGAAVPLLIGNHLLWRRTDRNPSSVYARFSREIIFPLCRRLSPKDALIVGVLSGIGEEVLFRGALNQLVIHWSNNLVALVVTSVLFAAVHFLGVMNRYGGMIPLYAAVGGVLWFAWYLTDSLAAAAITHGVYNFLAIMWIRALGESSRQSTSPSAPSTS